MDAFIAGCAALRRPARRRKPVSECRSRRIGSIRRARDRTRRVAVDAALAHRASCGRGAAGVFVFLVGQHWFVTTLPRCVFEPNTLVAFVTMGASRSRFDVVPSAVRGGGNFLHAARVGAFVWPNCRRGTPRRSELSSARVGTHGIRAVGAGVGDCGATPDPV